MRRHTTSSASEVLSEPGAQPTSTASHQAFWGIDLEALRKSNGPLIAGASGDREAVGPPIHTPQSARQYLLKSMKIVTEDTSQSGSKKKSAAEIMADKEEAAAVVLRAIEIVCESWASTLTSEELDRRAQSWYSLVRPDVAQGQAGWGQRGTLRLADLLRLRRTPS
jgi:hypothetical protein